MLDQRFPYAFPIEDVKQNAHAFAPSPGHHFTWRGTGSVGKYHNFVEARRRYADLKDVPRRLAPAVAMLKTAQARK